MATKFGDFDDRMMKKAQVANLGQQRIWFQSEIETPIKLVFKKNKGYLFLITIIIEKLITLCPTLTFNFK